MRLAEAIQTDSVAIAWQESSCPLCGCASFTPLLEAHDARNGGLRFLIVKCARCDLCFTNPRPEPASMDRFYPADYRCYRVKRNPSRADAMERWLRRDRSARLLDFGCGGGAFLLRMRNRRGRSSVVRRKRPGRCGWQSAPSRLARWMLQCDHHAAIARTRSFAAGSAARRFSLVDDRWALAGERAEFCRPGRELVR
jgi:hypothetical protein